MSNIVGCRWRQRDGWLSQGLWRNTNAVYAHCCSHVEGLLLHITRTPDCQSHPLLFYTSCLDREPGVLNGCTHGHFLRGQETRENNRSTWCQISRQGLQHLYQWP